MAENIRERPVSPQRHLGGLAKQGRHGLIRLAHIRLAWDAFRTARDLQDAIARRQQRRLHNLVSYARARSPYYRSLYQDLPMSPPDVRQLPAVTKQELMSRFDDWVTDPAVTQDGVGEFLADPENVGRDFLGKYLVCTTSGVTGTPAVLLHDHDALAVYNILGYVRSLPIALRSLQNFWALLRARGRLAAVFVTGGHYLGNAMWERRTRKMPWRRRTQRILSALAPLNEIVTDLNGFQPVMLGGYPSALKLLAQEQQAGRLHISPVLVSAAGENLSPQNRALIGSAFGCRVSNYYGSSEAVGLTFECTNQRLHVNSDWYILEPVDDKGHAVPPGQLSDGVLMTNLANKIQPIIRYQMGDRVIVDPDPCACGSPFAQIRVVGRSADVLIFTTSEGASVRILPLAIATVAEATPGVMACQLIQRAEAELIVRLSVKDGDDEQEVWSTLRERLAAFLSTQGVEGVTIEKADEPPALHPHSGKFTQVYSELAAPERG